MMLFTFSFLIFTYILAPLLITVFLYRILGLGSYMNFLLFFAASLGLAPYVISYILYISFLLFPHHNDFYYFSVVIFIFIVIFLISIRKLGSSAEIISSHLKPIGMLPGLKPWEILYILIILFSVFIVFTQCSFLPLHSNDGSVLYNIARIFYDQKSLEGYPFIQAHLPSGFYSTASHPPVFQMLYIWAFIFQGNSHAGFLVKSFSVLYFFFDIFVLFALVLRNFNRHAAIFVTAIFATTPVVMITSSNCFLDSFRLYPFFFSIFFLIETVKSGNFIKSKLALTCIGLIFTLLAHATHIPLILIVVLVAAPFFISIPLLRTRHIILLGFLTLIFGGVPYLFNYFSFGHLIFHLKESEITPKILELQSKSLLRLRDQLTLWGIIRNGRLQEFFDIDNFGLTAYLGLFGIIVWLKSREKQLHDWFIFLLGLLLYLFIKDPLSLTNNEFGYGIWSTWRYALPLLLFSLYFSAILFRRIYSSDTSLVSPSSSDHPHPTDGIKAGGVRQKIFLFFPYVIFIVLFLSARNGEYPLSEPWKLIYSPAEQYQRTDHYQLQLAINKFVNDPKNTGNVYYTFSPNFFVYSKARGVYYVDSSLEDFYAEHRVSQKVLYLSNLGITHFFIQRGRQYSRHYFYQEIQPILGDPSYTKLVYENDVIQIYKFRNIPGSLDKTNIDLGLDRFVNTLDCRPPKPEALDLSGEHRDEWLLYSHQKCFHDEINDRIEGNNIYLNRLKNSCECPPFQGFNTMYFERNDDFILRSPFSPAEEENDYILSLVAENNDRQSSLFSRPSKIQIYARERSGDGLINDTKLDSVLLDERNTRILLRFTPGKTSEAIAFYFKFHDIRRSVAIKNLNVVQVCEKNNHGIGAH